jgi:hypothetical protein
LFAGIACLNREIFKYPGHSSAPGCIATFSGLHHYAPLSSINMMSYFCDKDYNEVPTIATSRDINQQIHNG